MATPCGLSNLPLCDPDVPHLVRKLAVLLNFWTRSFDPSAAYTLPVESIATPGGPSNSPSPSQKIETHPPNFSRNVPVLVNFYRRLFVRSLT